MDIDNIIYEQISHAYKAEGKFSIKLGEKHIKTFYIGLPPLTKEEDSNSQYEYNDAFFDEEGNEFAIQVYNSHIDSIVNIILVNANTELIEKFKKEIDIQPLEQNNVIDPLYNIYLPPTDEPNFFTIRLSKENGIKKLVKYYHDKEYVIDFDLYDLSHHAKDIKKGDLIFLVGSGWKAKMSFPYTQGLYGIAKVTVPPYDIRGQHYNLKVRFILYFDNVIEKEAFKDHPETINIPYITLSSTGTKTQPVSSLSREQLNNLFPAIQEITQKPSSYFHQLIPWYFDESYMPSKQNMQQMTDNHKPVLNVVKIATVFAKFVKNYSHENTATMIGIFGKWGRGKTFFYQEVEKVLEKNDLDNEKFYFCTFQPWKYQEKESAWAYLYQTILANYLHEKPFQCNNFPSMKYPKLLWLNFKKFGFKKLFFLLAIIFTIFFCTDILSDFASLFKDYIPAPFKSLGIGAIILFLLYKLINDHGSTAFRLVNKYTKNHYFSDKLGFQNEIQKELKVLLETYISKNEKLIIFIDDLDRCNEHMIIDIIDSLKLMVDDPDIRKRVIILTAIDERILLRAIKYKYTHLENTDLNDLEKISIHEYIEKFFLMGIKLNKLDESDIELLLHSYADEINRVSKELHKDDHKKEELHIETDSGAEDQPENDSEREDQTKTSSVAEDQPENDSSIVANGVKDTEAESTTLPEKNLYLLSPKEQDYLTKRMKRIKNPTPRKINIFLHRYLFFKALASELLNQKTFNKTNPKLYIDLIFLIQNKDEYEQMQNKIYLYNQKYIEIEIFDNVYKVKTSDAIELLKISEMVSPF